MKLLLGIFCALTGWAQTNVYLRASGPASVPIGSSGCTNATPIVCQTSSPHNFPSTCNSTTNICYCSVVGVLTGSGASPANGAHECSYVDATHLALYTSPLDDGTGGNPIAGTGNWYYGSWFYANVTAGAQWIGKLTPFQIPSTPGPITLGGSSGELMRRISLSTSNGLATSNGISVSGCSGGVNCTVTVNVTYNPGAFGKFPVAGGQHFSITGTGTVLDTCGDGTAIAGPQSPYTVASVTGSSWISAPFTCAGLTNGDYTNTNLHCGPAPTPNDTIGGTQSCSRVSQMATTANPLWNALVSAMNNYGLNSASTYKSTFDGGSATPGSGMWWNYSQAAIRFLVDPTNALWLNEIIYSLNYDFRAQGVGYPINSMAFVQQSNGDLSQGTYDMIPLALNYEVATNAPEGSYWTPSERASFLDRMYNDFDDPSISACDATNQDAASASTHLIALSSGMVASGTNDSTHVQLPVTDPNYGTQNYYVNTVIALANGGQNGFSHYTYSLITSHSNTGLLTVNPLSTPASLQNLVSVNYNSGLQCTGTAGQQVGLAVGNGLVSCPLTSTGTNSSSLIASAASCTVWQAGSGFSSAPTTASPSNYNPGSASCSGTASIHASIGTAYTIYDTAVISSTSSGAAATISYTKSTNLSTIFHPGDGVILRNGWYQGLSSALMSYVTAVGANTLNVINGNVVSASTTNPQIAWRIPQWTAGDCGKNWGTKHQTQSAFGAQPALYGPGGGSGLYQAGGLIADVLLNGGGTDPSGWAVFEMATAADDRRAVRDLVRTEGSIYDYGIAPAMQFSTGRQRDGSGYSWDETAPVAERFLYNYEEMPISPAFPALDSTGPWAMNMSLFKMFQTLPDRMGNTPYTAGWAGASSAGYQGYSWVNRGSLSSGIALDPSLFFAPSSSNAAYFRNWSERINPSGSLWGNAIGSYAESFLHNDPRVADSDFTAQPLQYYFNSSSSPAATAQTGWTRNYRGDLAISRTCWMCSNGTYTQFDAASYTSPAVYDSARFGQISIWKTGCLICGDSNPANGFWNMDTTVLSDTFQFNGAAGPHGLISGLPPNVGMTPINQAAGSASNDPFGNQYGDAQSRYAAACASGISNFNQAALNITLDHMVRCWVHLKKSGNDEWIFQFDDVALANGSPTPALPMSWHLHYTQNGTPQTYAFCGNCLPTGSTTYLGNNVIEELEDGGGSNPARTHGLMSYVTSPLTITLNDDCVGRANGQCSPAAPYPGGYGFTHRFTVAGGSSTSATVSKFISVVGHKLMSNLSDTSFAPTNVNPDANWTGTQLRGANSTAVALFSVGGITHSTITTFTTDFSGAGDWLIMGVTPGTYAVTVAGVPVNGSPFTVGAGDTSIYFNTIGGGAFVMGPVSGVSATSISGSVSMAGNGVIR